MTRCRSQLSSVCPSGTSNGGSCGAISASPNAHCSPRSAAAVTTSGQWANSRAISSPDRRCEPPSGARQPAASSIELRARIAPIAMASLPRDGSAKCAAVVATSAEAEAGRQLGQHGVALVVEGMAVVGELDADPVAAEPVDQVGQRRRGRIRAAVGKRLADMAFTASGQDVPVPACRLGQRVVVVARVALLATGQMGRRQLTRQPAISLRPAGQHQQMRSRRIGLLGAGAIAQRQFGAEHRLHVQFLGGLGEAHHAVEAVVVGQRDGPQIEPGGLLDEFLRRAGTVEEAVRRMRVQLGIRHRRSRPVDVRRLVGSALARPGRAVAAVADLLVDWPPCAARLAV